jgi:hypothetical protein
MAATSKRRSEQLGRRKSTLLKKAHETAKFCDVDVALILRIHKTGRYVKYRSVDLESWPPTKDHCYANRYLNIDGVMCSVLSPV